MTHPQSYESTHANHDPKLQAPPLLSEGLRSLSDSKQGPTSFINLISSVLAMSWLQSLPGKTQCCQEKIHCLDSDKLWLSGAQQYRLRSQREEQVEVIASPTDSEETPSDLMV